MAMPDSFVHRLKRMIITAMLAFRKSPPRLSSSRKWKKMLRETLDEVRKISLAVISQQVPYFLSHKFHHIIISYKGVLYQFCYYIFKLNNILITSKQFVITNIPWINNTWKDDFFLKRLSYDFLECFVPLGLCEIEYNCSYSSSHYHSWLCRLLPYLTSVVSFQAESGLFILSSYGRFSVPLIAFLSFSVLCSFLGQKINQ